MKGKHKMKHIEDKQNKPTDRYLLRVNVNDNLGFDKTFKSYEAMKDYILERDFYFVNADYSQYDLAINIK